METEVKVEAVIDAEQTLELQAYIQNAIGRILPAGWNATTSQEEAASLRIQFEDGSHAVVLQARVILAERPTIKVATLSQDVGAEVVEKVARGLEYLAVEYVENQLRGKLFLTFVPGASLTPARTAGTRRPILDRILFGNMFGLLMLSVIISFALFLLFRELTPIALIGLQVVLLVLSRDLVARTGDWTLTPEAGVAHIVETRLPLDHLVALLNTQNREIYSVKEEIYANTFAKGSTPTPEKVAEVWRAHGISVPPEEIRVKSIDLYGTVADVASLYKIRAPKVVLSNTLRQNAAATGPLPQRSVMLMTTGALVSLGADELKAVIGHELSHIKNSDMLALFSLVSIEYLFRVYLFYTGFFRAVPYVGMLYLFGSLTAVYFIAKFLEARADLDSAYTIGDPSALSSALRKIGIRRLFMQKWSWNPVRDWLSWDPHPPISFRVRRLDGIATHSSREGGSTLFLSVRDCFGGFISAFRSTREK